MCKSAKKKVEVLLKRWDKTERHPVKLVDMKTPEGAAEGDYFDVFDEHIPAVFVMEDGWTVAKRWDAQAPPSGELHAALEGGK